MKENMTPKQIVEYLDGYIIENLQWSSYGKNDGLTFC